MTKLAFAHYFTQFPISADNKARPDTYDTAWMSPSKTADSGKWWPYGGWLRDRPIYRPPLPATTDWQLTDMQTEVRQAMSGGFDGFTLDLLSSSRTYHWDRQERLLNAAHSVDPNFKIMLMPDMGPMQSMTDAAFAARIKTLAAYPAAFRLGDGRLVMSPFHAELWTAARWKTALNACASSGVDVAFVPCFLNYSANIGTFISIPQLYGATIWGSGNPAFLGGAITNGNDAHNRGLIWMHPVRTQDFRPAAVTGTPVYDEAANTQTLRDSWTGARSCNADWVQQPTWNDYGENAMIAPTEKHGWAFTNLGKHLLNWWKAGSEPTETSDQLFLTHRQHPFAAIPTGIQTVLMKWRGGTPPRDTIEAATILTATSNVDILVNGSVVASKTQPAGLATFTTPLQPGVISARVTRSGQTDLVTTTPKPVVAVPVVQDMQYIAATAVRSPTSTVSVLFGVNDAALPTNFLDTLEGAYSSGSGSGISNRVPIVVRLSGWTAVTTAFATGSRELALFNAGHEIVVSFAAPSGSTAFATVSAGTYDADIQGLFDRIYALNFGGAVSGTQPGQSYGGTKASKVRIVFQPQADTSTAKGTATEFRAAFRHFFSVGKARRPLNAAERVISVINFTQPAAGNGQAALYYPGNATTDFVDEVSFNGFVSATATTTFAGMADPWLTWIASNAAGRKLGVLQAAKRAVSGSATAQSDWMAAMVAYLAAHPQMSFVCWWSQDDTNPPGDLSLAKSINTATFTAFHDQVALAIGAGAPTDVTAPSAPGRPSLVAQATTTAQIAWTAPPEPDVAKFKVKLDGTVVFTSADPTVLTYTFTGLSAGSSHVVSVSAVDGAGNISVDSATRTFTQPSSTDPLPPSISQSGTSVRRAGATVTAVGSATDPTAGTLVYTWDWGDGSIDNDTPATHTYVEVGDYSVVLTVRSSSGLSTQQTFPISILDSSIDRTSMGFYLPPKGEGIPQSGPQERANWQLANDKLAAVVTVPLAIDASAYPGYDASGTTDSAAAIRAAISDAFAIGPRVVLLRGTPQVASTILTGDNRGLTIVGDSMNRGTRVDFTGTGALFQHGTDTHVGDHYTGYYDGPAGLYIENLTLYVPPASRATALANGTGNYKANTTAIQDWYAGDIRLKNIRIQGFDTGFAGVQSDIDRWDMVEINGCHLGLSLGPRTDQITATALYILLCDRAVDADNVHGVRFIGCQFVGNGAPGVNPIRIRAAGPVGGLGSIGVFFDDCWFEHLQGYSAATLEAFVEVGVGDTYLSSDVHFRNPSIDVGTGTDPRMQYLVKVGNGDAVSVVNPNGSYWKNLTKLVLFVGSTNPNVLLEALSTSGATAFGFTNSGTGTPVVTTRP